MPSPETPRHAAVLDLVEVMDQLRSPGGCPWDAEQTHVSLVRYVVEEAHELAEAIEAGDRLHLREELGDVLLQVVFHARIAQEDPDDPFDLDDVAAEVAAKLRRRHPRVFTDETAEPAASAEPATTGATSMTGAATTESAATTAGATWDQIKALEKPERTSPLDGVPVTMPPLERATAFASRLERPEHPEHWAAAERAAAGQDLGSRLFALVLEGRRAGLDPSAELRATLRSLQSVVANPASGD